MLTTSTGFTLHESRSICEYLARKYSFQLVPAASDVEATALFNQAQSIEMQQFAEPAGKISFEKFVKAKYRGLPANEAVVSEASKSLETFFGVAERLLQEKHFMAGNEFTLVDIYYIPLILRLFACGCENVVTSRKVVSAWWERCMSRPAIKRMIADDKEAMAASPADKL